MESDTMNRKIYFSERKKKFVTILYTKIYIGSVQIFDFGRLVGN